jgi:hypothetical protein
MRKPLSLVAIALALCTLDATAQGQRKIAFRTLCLEHVDGIDKVVIPTGKAEETQEVTLFTDVSPVVEGSFATNEASFFVTSTSPDGKQVRELVGKAPLGKSNRQIFVFMPGKRSGEPLSYMVRAFDDDTEAFPMGTVRAINSSPVPIRFILSGAVTPQIPPLRHATFPHSKKVNDYNMYPVVVEFLSANGQWVKGQSVNWKATDQRREIVVTSVDTRFKQPAVKLYSDFPPWMEPSNAQP